MYQNQHPLKGASSAHSLSARQLREHMAIKISVLFRKNKRITKLNQAKVAKSIQKFLKRRGIDCDVKISAFYSDRWYPIDMYEEIMRR